jgi:heparan-alpha-glucosaminide N-acetyltransferase
MKTQAPKRIAAIDIFRAGTMFLMIFVNDLWTLEGVPQWMEHAKASEDRMGLSDWVFPGFLFIVGLSIPFAQEARSKKGESTMQIFLHILKRSAALIIMGFFMVNLESINVELLSIPKTAWQLLMATAIVLIWNSYPNKKAFGTIPVWVFQILGILILGWLALIYKGGSAETPSGMEPHWWGILGIIGWAYLLIASLYLFFGEKPVLFSIIVLFFYLLNALEFVNPFKDVFSIKLMVGASNHAIVATGVITSMVYTHFSRTGKDDKFMLFIIAGAVLLLAYGLLTRPIWEISKIRATPSWVGICTGISLAVFGILYIITDQYKKTRWAAILSPAGRSTLTCYLVPYFYYAILVIVGYYLPESLRTGYVGIIKSLLFALLIVSITGLLERVSIRLKI